MIYRILIATTLLIPIVASALFAQANQFFAIHGFEVGMPESILQSRSNYLSFRCNSTGLRAYRCAKPGLEYIVHFDEDQAVLAHYVYRETDEHWRQRFTPPLEASEWNFGNVVEHLGSTIGFPVALNLRDRLAIYRYGNRTGFAWMESDRFVLEVCVIAAQCVNLQKDRDAIQVNTGFRCNGYSLESYRDPCERNFISSLFD